MLVQIHAAGRNFMEQRFPQVRARTIEQRDARPLPAAETVAEPRRKLEPAGATADDHDAMQFRFGRDAHRSPAWRQIGTRARSGIWHDVVPHPCA
jgi:hypothetical protein